MRRFTRIGRSILAVLAGSALACATPRAVTPVDQAAGGGHSHGTDDLGERCDAPGAEHDPDLAEICRQVRVRFYRDTRDGGPDVFRAGCHLVFDNAQCRGQGRLFPSSGDLCRSRRTIAEWTDPTCHPARPVDSAPFDCETECQKRGAQTGVCVTDENFCATGIDSAHCECVEL
jgi:hypothetical protein